MILNTWAYYLILSRSRRNFISFEPAALPAVGDCRRRQRQALPAIPAQAACRACAVGEGLASWRDANSGRPGGGEPRDLAGVAAGVWNQNLGGLFGLLGHRDRFGASARNSDPRKF